MRETNPRLVEKIRACDSELRDLTESDLRCAKYAEKLLTLLDESGGDH